MQDQTVSEQNPLSPCPTSSETSCFTHFLKRFIAKNEKKKKLKACKRVKVL